MAKTTVALNPAGHAAAAALGRFQLPETVDLVRLGFAYAIRTNLDTRRPDGFGVPGGAGNYTASTGTLDQDRRLEQLVIAMYPTDADDPYLAVETLVNKGLIALAEALERGEIGSLTDLLDTDPFS